MDFQRFFGFGATKNNSANKDPAGDTSETLQMMRSNIDSLEKRQKYLESKVQKELQVAKTHAANKNQKGNTAPLTCVVNNSKKQL
jgi:hypothetical protein